jgi:hypothetical protein
MLAVGMYSGSHTSAFSALTENAPVCFLGGPIVNKIGVKWALVLGAMSFPIQGSAYYCNSKFGNQWVSGKALPEHIRQFGAFSKVRSDSVLAVPHSQRCYQWCWDRLLVCRGGRSHHDSRTFRRSWKVSGSVDCVAKSWTAGWRCNQVRLVRYCVMGTS